MDNTQANEPKFIIDTLAAGRRIGRRAFETWSEGRGDITDCLGGCADNEFELLKRDGHTINYKAIYAAAKKDFKRRRDEKRGLYR